MTKYLGLLQEKKWNFISSYFSSSVTAITWCYKEKNTKQNGSSVEKEEEEEKTVSFPASKSKLFSVHF